MRVEELPYERLKRKLGAELIEQTETKDGVTLTVYAAEVDDDRVRIGVVNRGARSEMSAVFTREQAHRFARDLLRVA
jgi:hypothetical protein